MAVSCVKIQNEMALLDKLQKFNYSHSSVKKDAWEELSDRFSDLARDIMYGGYIDVHGVYRIYVRAVEFYFHEEDGTLDDNIVYHRNGKLSDIAPVPCFPTMSLHAHASGFDITFEKYGHRTSSLIRKYAIYDTHRHSFIKRPKPKNAPKSCAEWEDYRSTYLYDFLNGFSLTSDNRILWKDLEIGNTKAISKAQPRIHTQDDRRWRFVAEEDIQGLIK